MFMRRINYELSLSDTNHPQYRQRAAAYSTALRSFRKSLYSLYETILKTAPSPRSLSANG